MGPNDSLTAIGGSRAAHAGPKGKLNGHSGRGSNYHAVSAAEIRGERQDHPAGGFAIAAGPQMQCRKAPLDQTDPNLLGNLWMESGTRCRGVQTVARLLATLAEVEWNAGSVNLPRRCETRLTTVP